MMPYVCMVLLGTFLASVSQVMLKKAALRSYKTKIQEYLNPLVIFAYVIFICTTLLNIYAYRGIPLSMGLVLETTSYIYVTIWGVTIFGEKFNFRKLQALTLIIGGILVYSLLG
jgi:multidrug transporter EmrE-like cation transporter